MCIQIIIYLLCSSTCKYLHTYVVQLPHISKVTQQLSCKKNHKTKSVMEYCSALNKICYKRRQVLDLIKILDDHSYSGRYFALLEFHKMRNLDPKILAEKCEIAKSCNL